MRSFLVNYFTFAILPFRGINALITTAMTTRGIGTGNSGPKRGTSGPLMAAAATSKSTTTSPTASTSSSSNSSTLMPPPLYLAEGLIAVHKPLTWTSNDVVSYVRGVLIRDAKDRGVTDDDDDDYYDGHVNGNRGGNGKRRKWTGRRKKQLMKVGHGGTLDPLASGVLVLGIGRGTTMLQSFLEGDKRYVATVQLGYETDTLDSEGRIIKTAPWEHVVGTDISTTFESRITSKFTGKIRQVPPLYSAIRVDGERLYTIARNADPTKTSGGDVNIPTREVMVYSLRAETSLGEDVIRSGMVDGPRYREEARRVVDDLTAAAAADDAVSGLGTAGDDTIDDVGEGGGGDKKRKRGRKKKWNDKDKNNGNYNGKMGRLFDEITVPSIRHEESALELPRFALSVNCGGGTYIRSLVRDIGYELGTVATMTGLVRTKQGPFVLGDALRKDDWTADMIYDAIRRCNQERRNYIDTDAVINIRGGGQDEEGEVEEEMLSAAPTPASFYPIGTPGKPWTEVERSLWKSGVKVQRSYKAEVLDELDRLDDDVWDVVRYGSLPHDQERYPLYGVRNRNWGDDKPCILITGGVHGYETSGVKGAILFLQAHGKKYAELVNILVIPCVSPWAYEHVQRWNADLKDVNRSFKEGSETDESSALLSYLDSLDVDMWTCHVDLHETTDTDATEFMPAKHAEAGLMYEAEAIPDGFYLACDSENSQLDFQDAIIASVRDVTHIAPPDVDGNIIGVHVVRDGIILLPAKELGLCCGGATSAKFTTTTEVYPDSPRATDEICNRAQVAAIVGALEYVLSSHNK
ncbi:hypothetical protein ACHAXA_005182 [Cyclostephanos tholiformis]|uniref:tRNA pseudouridine(55) synthase n=1 Tax=Cyclostephanos tholiformis TaxID=382380 RepID=A0ABD3RJ87_9STRA